MSCLGLAGKGLRSLQPALAPGHRQCRWVPAFISFLEPAGHPFISPSPVKKFPWKCALWRNPVPWRWWRMCTVSRLSATPPPQELQPS